MNVIYGIGQDHSVQAAFEQAANNMNKALNNRVGEMKFLNHSHSNAPYTDRDGITTDFFTVIIVALFEPYHRI